MQQLPALRLVSVLSFLSALAVVPAGACIWDRDTLAMEARGLPGVVEILTGRFFRPPPEYYEMRLSRVRAEILAEPTRFDLYDDAAVACDRLGQSGRAIDWMAQKREAMDDAIARGVDTGDHGYRFHANLGTFFIHRWLRDGADREAMQDVESAREHIAAAIEINPEAHFGRESYQLLAIDWILDPPVMTGELPSMLDATPTARTNGHTGPTNPRGDPATMFGVDGAVEALCGLVVLGDAWESFDVFYALGIWLDQDMAAPLALLAQLRCAELLEAGGTTLYPLDVSGGVTPDPGSRPDSLAIRFIGEPTATAADVGLFYSVARQEAREWHALKTEFMLSRLREGSHPDTDPGFWDGFNEPPPPTLPGAATLYIDSHMDPLTRTILLMLLVFVVIVSVPLLLLIKTVLHMRARNRNTT